MGIPLDECNRKKRKASSWNYAIVRLMICLIGIWSSSCINVKEYLVLQKNGKGSFSLEWDMSAARLFSNGEEVLSAVEPGYLALLKELERVPGIQLSEADTYLRASSAQLSFQYKSLDALNEAMTLIYLGENLSSYEFIQQEGALITRSMPAGVGERLFERWKTYWNSPFSQVEKASVRWDMQMECKSTVHLVYSPLPAKISPDQHVVNWNITGEELFGTSTRLVKILAD